jgi:hypothetical protein
MAKKAENASNKKAEPKKTGGGKGRLKWFDDKSHAPLIESYVQNLDTFIATMADGRVDQNELQAQEGRLIKVMKEVEPLLDDPLHEKVTQLLCELTAYDIMQLLHTMDAVRPRSKFQG